MSNRIIIGIWAFLATLTTHAVDGAEAADGLRHRLIHDNAKEVDALPIYEIQIDHKVDPLFSVLLIFQTTLPKKACGLVLSVCR